MTNRPDDRDEVKSSFALAVRVMIKDSGLHPVEAAAIMTQLAAALMQGSGLDIETFCSGARRAYEVVTTIMKEEQN